MKHHAHYFFLVISVTGMLPASCQSGSKDIIADGAKLTLVAAEYEFTEGPAADKDGNVFFTDQPNNRILKWDADSGKVSTYLQPAGRANGLYFDRNGDLLAAADEKFELWRIDSSKNVKVLLGAYNGQKLNGPNDLWVHPEGGIYFTDPYYQRPYWDRKKGELERQQVYFLNPETGEVRAVEEDLVQPNGIIGIPDGKTLYIADIGDGITYSYTIGSDGSLTAKTLFCGMGSDGMTLDEMGNLYLTGDGVTVFNLKGEKIVHIPVPQKWTANVTFGGSERNTLFITAMNSVYTLNMKVHGAQ